MKLMMGTQSAAQRYMFFAERQAAKVDDIPADTKLRPIKKVGVVGAGTMGGGISMNFLIAGIPVTIVETAQEALDRGVGVIRKNYENSAKKGRFTPEKVEAMMGLLTPTLEPRRPRRLRPHHRGDLREYGRQEGAVRQARRHRQARRDPRLQHLLSQHRRDRRRRPSGPKT